MILKPIKKHSCYYYEISLGVIRECGGKMHLREGEFEKAHTDFFEAFKVDTQIIFYAYLKGYIFALSNSA